MNRMRSGKRDSPWNSEESPITKFYVLRSFLTSGGGDLDLAFECRLCTISSDSVASGSVRLI
jgi:hypothetical protein